MSSEMERILGKSEQHGKQFFSAIVREGLQRPVNGPVDSGASPKQAFIPPERTGLNGQYDQSGLAKRVARMFEKDGMNPEHSVWVAQRGDSVVLEGKINGARALKELVELASSKQLARTVDSSRILLS